jgi:hypothetical protein
MKKLFKKIFKISTASFFAIFAVGCTTSQGDFSGQRTETGVSLAENNYKIIKAGAMGESQGFNLLIFPVVSPNFAEAKSKLYADVGESLVGRSIALANQTQDFSKLDLIIFSIPKVTITADIIEFTSRSNSGPTKYQKK